MLGLGGGGDFVVWTVNRNDRTNDELAKIDKGQKMTVVGEFDDGGDLGVELAKCKLT